MYLATAPTKMTTISRINFTIQQKDGSNVRCDAARGIIRMLGLTGNVYKVAKSDSYTSNAKETIHHWNWDMSTDGGCQSSFHTLMTIRIAADGTRGSVRSDCIKGSLNVAEPSTLHDLNNILKGQ